MAAEVTSLPDAVGPDSRPAASQAVEPPTAETGVMPAVGSAESTDPADSQAAEQPAASAAPDRLTPRVLIVEDAAELAELVMVTLRRIQVVAVAEAGGEKAVSRYIECKPAVVLLDLNLPDMTGWKVLESIKDYSAQNKLPMPRIIVMTAMGDPANRLVGKLQGVYSYLVKPFTPTELQNVVRTALAASG